MDKQEYKKYKQTYMEKDGVKLGPSMILSKHLERPLYHPSIGNANILAIGDQHSGMRKSVALSNLLQMTGSYMVYDFDGSLLKSAGPVLREFGYEVKELHLFTQENTEIYNPFQYFEKESDVLSFAETLISSDYSLVLKPEVFREQLKLFLAACIYIVMEAEEKQKDMDQVWKIVNAIHVSENGTFDETTTQLFVSYKDDSVSNKFYKLFMETEVDTRKSCVEECKMLLHIFSKEESPHLNGTDTLHLEDLQQKRTAFFITTASIERKYEVVVSALFQQAYHTIRRKNDTRKYHVTFLMKSLLRLPILPDLHAMLSEAEKWKSSFLITVLDVLQLKMAYGDDWEKLWEACGTKIYMGTTEAFTNRYLGQFITESVTKSNHKNCIVFYESHGKAQMLIDTKYQVQKHPLYYLIAEKESV